MKRFASFFVILLMVLLSGCEPLPKTLDDPLNASSSAALEKCIVSLEKHLPHDDYVEFEHAYKALVFKFVMESEKKDNFAEAHQAFIGKTARQVMKEAHEYDKKMEESKRQ